MAKFFPQFPKIQYNLSGKNGNTNSVTDIFRRVKIRSKIADNVSLLDKYDVAFGLCAGKEGFKATRFKAHIFS